MLLWWNVKFLEINCLLNGSIIYHYHSNSSWSIWNDVFYWFFHCEENLKRSVSVKGAYFLFFYFFELIIIFERIFFSSSFSKQQKLCKSFELNFTKKNKVWIQLYKFWIKRFNVLIIIIIITTTTTTTKIIIIIKIIK